MKKYKSGMVFGVYSKIETRHALLLKNAFELCDFLYVVVSSDKEVESLYGQTPKLSLVYREAIISEFCRKEFIKSKVLADQNMTPADFLLKHPVDAFILSNSQYERFGKELNDILKINSIKSMVEVVM